MPCDIIGPICHHGDKSLCCWVWHHIHLKAVMMSQVTWPGLNTAGCSWLLTRQDLDKLISDSSTFYVWRQNQSELISNLMLRPSVCMCVRETMWLAADGFGRFQTSERTKWLFSWETLVRPWGREEKTQLHLQHRQAGQNNTALLHVWSCCPLLAVWIPAGLRLLLQKAGSVLGGSWWRSDGGVAVSNVAGCHWSRRLELLLQITQILSKTSAESCWSIGTTKLCYCGKSDKIKSHSSVNRK